MTALFFDFDGTLFFGTEDMNLFSMNKALEDMGRPPMSHAQLLSTIGDTLDGICSTLLGTDDPVLKARFYKGIMSYVPQAIQSCATMRPQVLAMLEELKEHAPLAICSNADPLYLMPLLKKFDMEKYFQYIWHYKEGYRKVDAVGRLKAMFKAEKAVMIGDRLEDVESGKANGCVTVALKNGIGPQDADGADYTVYDHEQMLRVLLSLCG